MSQQPLEPFEIVSPCCQAKLRVDPELQAVLSFEPPPEERRIKDLSDGVKGLRDEAAQRPARFEESLKAEKQKTNLHQADAGYWPRPIAVGPLVRLLRSFEPS